MIDTELAAIRARLEAATPGPWKHARRLPVVYSEHPEMRCQIYTMMHRHGQVDWSEGLERWNRDAEFIACAPDDIRALVAKVEQLLPLAQAGLVAHHGHHCEMVGGAHPTDPSECSDAVCRSWAFSVRRSP